jgi:DNA-binding response OmpR family regulator
MVYTVNIFLLEDDISLQKGISLKLLKEGYMVQCAEDMSSAMQFMKIHFDLAIIDINLPDGNGLDICKKLRSNYPDIHILILTANDMETDIVMGYELGADDYVTKPFSLSVLLSKINAVKRRMHKETDKILFNPVKQTATINGRILALTRNETRLLDAFLKNAGQILTKNQLLETLWDINGEFVDENTLAVNIRRLREKMENDPSNPLLIENIRGIGYRFNMDVL